MAIQVIFTSPPPPPMFIIRRHQPPPPPIMFIHPLLLFHPQQQEIYEQDYYKCNVNNNNNDNIAVTKSRWMSSGNIKILKLNTDGCSKGNPGPSSYGGLIRDSKGRWLCGYMGRMQGNLHTSLEAEVWSIFKGLCLIKEKNLSNLLIETDCESILRLRPESFDKNHPLRKVMQDIGTIKMEQKCVIIHTRRDGNQSADLLANFGGRQPDDYIFLEHPPAMLLPYLLRDTASAVQFERNGQ